MNTPTKKRKREGTLTEKSIQYFEPILETATNVNHTPSKKTHVCTLCKFKLNGNHEWNLASHLKSRHPIEFEKIADKQKDLNHPAIRRLKLLQHLTEIVTVNGRPFAHLYDSGFQAIIKDSLTSLQEAGVGLNLSHHNMAVVKEHLEQTAKKIRDQISVEVKGRPLSLLVDIVTKHGRSILGFSLQYSYNGDLKVRSIGMIELIKSHTGKYLAQTIIARLEMHGISLKQILTITTDNGKNVLKMVRDMEDYLNNEIENAKRADKNVNTNDIIVIDGDDENTDEAIEELLAQTEEISDEEALDRVFEEVEALDANKTLLEVVATEMLSLGVEYLWDITGINCAAHTLELGVKDSIKAMNKGDTNVLKLCRRVCRKLCLRKTCAELEDVGIKYKLPRLQNETRWGSMFLMLSDIIGCENAVIHFANVKKEKMFKLLLKKWSILKEIVVVLKVPFNVTIAFQNQRLTLSDVYGRWLGAQLHLDMLRKKKSMKTKLAEHLYNFLDKRKTVIFENPCMASALYLDPRFHSVIIECPEKTELAKNNLLNIWRRIIVLESNSEPVTEVIDVSNGDSSFEFDEEAALLKHLNRAKTSNTVNSRQYNDIEFIIDLFNPEPLDPKESVLNYWERQKDEQKELYKLAMVIFSVPPTEVQIERDFSGLDFIFTNRRGRLSHQRLEDILLIYLNKDLFYFINDEDIATLQNSI